ncbi:nucleotidyltransferase family protein [Candidatus Pelagibacter sp. HIMB1623]|uniref:nucleotidyltransferase family protein n=1 Tax=Candidatus Pelagibacter sp. HIMB1623 TaxID=3413358 RepID=UPI003F85CAD3
MKNIEKIKITLNAKIKEALKIISDGRIQIAIVVDKKGKLLGTLTDGDIRRGLLNGLNVDSSIRSLVFKKPITVKKNESKKKILKIAISKNIYQIPVVDSTGKVISVHVLNELIKPKNKSNLVVIMAGGKGMRLRPLTKHIPKPMLKVGNKPIIQTLIEKFDQSGYKNFLICVNYKSKVIKDYFGDGSKFGVSIKYIEEKIRMGTAGSLSLLRKKPKDPFFVINGDLLINLDFEKMLDFHFEHNSKATMCINEYNIDSPYGEVKLDNENIISIKEKPKHKYFVNSGIYILDPECIGLIPKKFYDMTSLFKKMIVNKYKIVSFPLGEYWLDIGRLNDFKKANLEYNNFFNNKMNIKLENKS